MSQHVEEKKPEIQEEEDKEDEDSLEAKEEAARRTKVHKDLRLWIRTYVVPAYLMLLLVGALCTYAGLIYKFYVRLIKNPTNN